jgi:hypothetical protein
MRVQRSNGYRYLVVGALLSGGVAACSSDAGVDAGKDGASDAGIEVGADATISDVGADGSASDAIDATADSQIDGKVDMNPFEHPIAEVGVDGNVPAPMDLTATVLARRQTSFHLAWTAPSSGGQGVSGYVVRVARVPITAANFDDVGTTTMDVLYTKTPAAPGAVDGIDIPDLVIENDYYFAVAAVDSSNARGPIAATQTKSRATFNSTVLTGANGATEAFGLQFDAGDADRNGISDLLVGVSSGKHAYLFLNHMKAPAVAASVTFSGDATTTASFGRGVAFIGDIDDDGFEDLAVSDRGTSAHIYIYKGRQVWPATLSNTEANYVITVDATYDNSIFGAAMARLGDFNGDGVDDFAIGATQFGGTGLPGRAVIVLGKVGFAGFALPNAANTIVIDGDPAVTTPMFGYRLVGLGHFYAGTGTTLVVSAPGNSTAASGNEGRLYAFHGQTGSSGAISSATANHILVGPAGNNRIGAALANLGPMVNTLPSLGSGNPVDRVSTPNGSDFVLSGSSASGPFASKIVASQPTGGLSGMAIIGGGISGRDEVFSLIGDATPDLVMLSRDSPSFQIVDGRTIRSTPSPIDTTAKASVIVTLPGDWTTTGEAEGTLLPDIDGDGYPDFAIGNAIGSVAGKVIAYW